MPITGFDKTKINMKELLTNKFKKFKSKNNKISTKVYITRLTDIKSNSVVSIELFVSSTIDNAIEFIFCYEKKYPNQYFFAVEEFLINISDAFSSKLIFVDSGENIMNRNYRIIPNYTTTNRI